VVAAAPDPEGLYTTEALTDALTTLTASDYRPRHARAAPGDTLNRHGHGADFPSYFRLGFATLEAMKAALRAFGDGLKPGKVGLFYFAGYGVQVQGKNYLIPVNADIKREYEVVDQAFDASQFLEMMDNIRGPNNKRVNILIVDACRNNELQKSWRSTNNGLARMDAPGGTFISFATAPGRVAADGVGRNSPYTKHLLQALKQPNVPIEQVFKVVRRNVMEETKGEQIPWENSSLVGDFYFTVQR
jgi:uncharacterized caspase-like protein